MSRPARCSISVPLHSLPMLLDQWVEVHNITHAFSQLGCCAGSGLHRQVAAFSVKPFNLLMEPPARMEVGACLHALLALVGSDAGWGAEPCASMQVWVVDSRRHLLLASMHHAITDGWSAAMLKRELSAAYAAATAGSKPAWAPLPVQMVDYAVWQRQHISGAVLDAHLDWWRQTLSGAPPLLELPWDHRRPEVAGHAGVAVPLQIPPAVTAKLRDIAAAEHTTLFSMVLAAIQVCFPDALRVVAMLLRI